MPPIPQKSIQSKTGTCWSSFLDCLSSNVLHLLSHLSIGIAGTNNGVFWRSAYFLFCDSSLVPTRAGFMWLPNLSLSQLSLLSLSELLPSTTIGHDGPATFSEIHLPCHSLLSVSKISQLHFFTSMGLLFLRNIFPHSSLESWSRPDDSSTSLSCLQFLCLSWWRLAGKQSLCHFILCHQCWNFKYWQMNLKFLIGNFLYIPLMCTKKNGYAEAICLIQTSWNEQLSN